METNTAFSVPVRYCMHLVINTQNNPTPKQVNL